MTEIWKAVPGYEGQYEVSDFGRVRSLDRDITRLNRWGTATTRLEKGRLLRPGTMNVHSHVSVALCGRSRCVHELVLAAFFVGPVQPGHDVRHLNGHGGDNKLYNLAYGSRSENNRDISRHNRRKLTVRQVKEVRQRHAAGEPGYLLAKEYGVCRSNMYYVLRGAYYGHL